MRRQHCWRDINVSQMLTRFVSRAANIVLGTRRTTHVAATMCPHLPGPKSYLRTFFFSFFFSRGSFINLTQCSNLSKLGRFPPIENYLEN